MNEPFYVLPLHCTIICCCPPCVSVNGTALFMSRSPISVGLSIWDLEQQCPNGAWVSLTWWTHLHGPSPPEGPAPVLGHSERVEKLYNLSRDSWMPSVGAIMSPSGLDSVLKQLIILPSVAAVPPDPHLQPNWRLSSCLGRPLSLSAQVQLSVSEAHVSYLLRKKLFF